MKLHVLKAATSFVCHIFVQDSASTAGAGKTGLDNTKIALAYMRAGAAAAVSVSTINTISTFGTFAGSATAAAFKEVDATNLPGVYELHIPNNALATGANQVVLLIRDAASNGVAAVPIEIQLTSFDPNDAARLGLTSLPNAVPAGSGGLATVDASNRIAGIQGAVNTLANLDATVSSRSSYAGGDTAGTTTLLTRIPGTVSAQTGDSYARLGAPAGASHAADIAAVKTDSGGIRTDYTTARATKLDSLDAAVTTRLATAGYTAPPTVVAVRQEIDSNSTKLDVAVSTRLATSGYTAAPTAVQVRQEIDSSSTKLDATVSSRNATAPDNASITAIKAKTDNLPAAPAAVSNIPTALQNADALLGRDMSAVAGAAARSPLNALRFLRNKWTVISGVLSVKAEDDTTQAWQATVTQDGTAQPVTGVDPQ